MDRKSDSQFGNNFEPSIIFFFSRGPKEGDDFVKDLGFVYTGTYKWEPSQL